MYSRKSLLTVLFFDRGMILRRKRDRPDGVTRGEIAEDLEKALTGESVDTGDYLKVRLMITSSNVPTHRELPCRDASATSFRTLGGSSFELGRCGGRCLEILPPQRSAICILTLRLGSIPATRGFWTCVSAHLSRHPIRSTRGVYASYTMDIYRSSVGFHPAA